MLHTMFWSTFAVLLFTVKFSTPLSIFPDNFKSLRDEPINENEGNGEPLILTPYIKSGRIQEARNAARVYHEAFQNITHYTGFFTVNQTHNTNLFTWFIPSESDPANDPVVLWLQGGPGSTSQFGLFAENGPFRIIKETHIGLRNETWTKKHNMLWIDNPAGTGYSFTDATGLANSGCQVTRELFQAIQQFFHLFPELRQNDFFITGESYGGHYIPRIAHQILRANRVLAPGAEINLKGLAIGNGWIDPANQLDYGDYLYQHGIVDLNTKIILDNLRDDIKNLISQGRYDDANYQLSEIIQTIKKVTGIKNLYNYLFPLEEIDQFVMEKFIQKSEIRRAIHVGNTKFQHEDVKRALNDDVMRSVAHLLPELLDNYRVLLYSGQFDILVAYPLTVNFLQKLKFSSSVEYQRAERKVWYLDEDIAGFVKVAGNLTDLLVRNAGHVVAQDQPLWALDLIYRFTRNLKFNA